MKTLDYELRKLCERNRDNSYSRQGDRRQILKLICKQLRELGFLHMSAASLKRKHVEALVERWLGEGLDPGTIKNRVSHLRWWAQKVGRSSEIPRGNAALGIPNRQYPTNENKATQLAAEPGITNPYVLMSAQLQQELGLRREECIKFQPSFADQGHCVQIKQSWAKGGRARIIPITKETQRAVLNRAHTLAGKGSLIPPSRSYIQQRNVYDRQCRTAGLRRMHGLRHAYAQARYEVLTGWKAPAAGGPTVRMLTPQQRMVDRQARQIISRELGHERISITARYLGR
jgi:integrase